MSRWRLGCSVKLASDGFTLSVSTYRNLQREIGFAYGVKTFMIVL